MVSPNLFTWIEIDLVRVPKVLEIRRNMSVYSNRLKYSSVYFNFTPLKTISCIVTRKYRSPWSLYVHLVKGM